MFPSIYAQDTHLLRDSQEAPSQLSDEELISAALEKAGGLSSNYAIARSIGVSEGTVRGWQKGSTGLRNATREILRRYVFGAAGAEAAEEWLLDFERVVRNVGGREGTLPEDERRTRQRDMVNGMIAARKQRGADVPAALYALLGRIEHGEL